MLLTYTHNIVTKFSVCWKIYKHFPFQIKFNLSKYLFLKSHNMCLKCRLKFIQFVKETHTLQIFSMLKKGYSIIDKWKEKNHMKFILLTSLLDFKYFVENYFEESESMYKNTNILKVCKFLHIVYHCNNASK